MGKSTINGHFHSYFDTTRGYNHRNRMESPSITMKFPMKIPPVPLCFEPFNVFFQCFIWISPALPRKLGQLCGENSGLPTLCTDGWKGKGALAEGRAAAGEGHYLYIYIYIYVCVPGEKIWGCNVVNPCKPNHRPPILEALSIGWGKKMIWWLALVAIGLSEEESLLMYEKYPESRNYICKSCCVSHVFYKPLKMQEFFWGEKHADVVSCGKLFTIFASFFRKLLCSQCFCYEESSDKNWRSGDESLRGSKS